MLQNDFLNASSQQKKTLFETQILCWHQQKTIKTVNVNPMLQICRIYSFKFFLLLFTEILSIIYIKNDTFYSITQCCAKVIKKIRHFENSPLIFTWHHMAPICARFHCHNIFSLENTKVEHFCPSPSAQIKYATPDAPHKIGLKISNIL